MNRVYIATCAIWFPLFGCTGTVGENSSVSQPAAGGALIAEGSSGVGGTSASDGGLSSVAGAGSNGSLSSAAGAGSNGSLSSGAGASAGATSASGSSSVTAAGGASATGGGATVGVCATDALPTGVQSMLTNKCATCHGATPLPGLPTLVSYAGLTAASKTDPSKTNAVLALSRIQSSTSPMPPAPGAPVSAADIAALQGFITQGYPKPGCPAGAGGTSSAGGSGSGGGGNTAGGGPPSLDPLFALATCTSKASWSGGSEGSASMNPGMACISCHSSGEGPGFSVAGTVYPTGHEPDRCNSLVGNAGARIVIVGADGKMFTLTPNAAGNFSSNAAVKTPYQAKVTYQGRERLMLSMQSTGDCNSCHTQTGNNSAPGRITVP